MVTSPKKMSQQLQELLQLDYISTLAILAAFAVSVYYMYVITVTPLLLSATPGTAQKGIVRPRRTSTLKRVKLTRKSLVSSSRKRPRRTSTRTGKSPVCGALKSVLNVNRAQANKAEGNFARTVVLPSLPEEECAICLDSMREQYYENMRNQPAKRAKGLFMLQRNCSHVFCVPCLERWREKADLNRYQAHCPYCRRVSMLTLMHHHYLVGEAEKNRLFLQLYCP